jgi:hypothetical protein
MVWNLTSGGATIDRRDRRHELADVRGAEVPLESLAALPFLHEDEVVLDLGVLVEAVANAPCLRLGRRRDRLPYPHKLSALDRIRPNSTHDHDHPVSPRPGVDRHP